MRAPENWLHLSLRLVDTVLIDYYFESQVPWKPYSLIMVSLQQLWVTMGHSMPHRIWKSSHNPMASHTSQAVCTFHNLLEKQRELWGQLKASVPLVKLRVTMCIVLWLLWVRVFRISELAVLRLSRTYTTCTIYNFNDNCFQPYVVPN